MIFISEEMREESWRRKFSGDMKMENAEPNVGHLAISSLVNAGKVTHIITQNVDGLHQNPARRMSRLSNCTVTSYATLV